MCRSIPIMFVLEPIALKKADAAKAIGISKRTLWKKIAIGKIKVTEDGTISTTELQRYVTLTRKHQRELTK